MKTSVAFCPFIVTFHVRKSKLIVIVLPLIATKRWQRWRRTYVRFRNTFTWNVRHCGPLRKPLFEWVDSRESIYLFGYTVKAHCAYFHTFSPLTKTEPPLPPPPPPPDPFHTSGLSTSGQRVALSSHAPRQGALNWVFAPVFLHSTQQFENAIRFIADISNYAEVVNSFFTA